MDIHTFLAHAVELELESETAYLKLVEMMTGKGHHDAAEIFREMADFSRVHWDTAMKRAGFDDSTDISSVIASWPGSKTEIPILDNSENPLDLDGAMLLALATEKRGVSFYEEVLRTTSDIQSRLLAEEFVTEEREHVQALERFFGLVAY
jgi:rubrerythrin